MEAWLILERPSKTPSPCVTLPNLFVLGQTVSASLQRFVRKIWPLASRLVRSVRIMGSKNGLPLAYLVSAINGDFGRKSQCFPSPGIWCPLLAEGFPLEFWNGGGLEKLECCPYQSVKMVTDDMRIRSDTILAMDNNGRRRTETVKQYCSLRAIHDNAR